MKIVIKNRLMNFAKTINIDVVDDHDIYYGDFSAFLSNDLTLHFYSITVYNHEKMKPLIDVFMDAYLFMQEYNFTGEKCIEGFECYFSANGNEVEVRE